MEAPVRALVALRRRLAAFEDLGDDTDLFTDEATGDAAEIVTAARVAGQGTPWVPVALATVGQLYWRRRLTAEDPDGANLHAAKVLFTRAYAEDRATVPETLWAELAGFDHLNVEESLVAKGIPELCGTVEYFVGTPEALPWLSTVVTAAAAMTAPWHSERPLLLGWLAVLHFRRGDRERGAERAGEVAEALVTCPAASCWLLSQLGEILRVHGSLDMAVTLGRRAEGRAGAEDPNRPSVLHNLGAALLSRYATRAGLRDVRAVDDLVEALDRCREAVATGQADRVSFLLHAAGYAGAVIAWSGGADDLTALEEAEYVLRHGLSRAAEDNPHVPFVHLRLGEIAECRGAAGAAESSYATALRLLAPDDPLHAVVRDALAELRER